MVIVLRLPRVLDSVFLFHQLQVVQFKLVSHGYDAGFEVNMVAFFQAVDHRLVFLVVRSRNRNHNICKRVRFAWVHFYQDAHSVRLVGAVNFSLEVNKVAVPFYYIFFVFHAKQVGCVHLVLDNFGPTAVFEVVLPLGGDQYCLLALWLVKHAMSESVRSLVDVDPTAHCKDNQNNECINLANDNSAFAQSEVPHLNRIKNKSNLLELQSFQGSQSKSSRPS